MAYEIDDEEDDQAVPAAAPLPGPPPMLAAPGGAGLPPPGVPPVVRLTTTTGTGQTSTTKISKPAQKAHDAYMGQMAQTARNLEKQRDAAVEVQNAQAQAKQEVENNAISLSLEEQDREKRAKEFADQRMSEFERVKQDLAANRDYKGSGGLWANRSTGDRVLAAISLAMGAFASKGGDNQAMKILDSALDDDYAKWKDRYAAMERAVIRSGGDADKAREQFEVALAARKSAAKDAAAAIGNTMIERAKTDEQKQRGQALVDKQLQDKAKAEADFQEQTNVKSVYSTNTVTRDVIPKNGANQSDNPLAIFDLNGNYVGNAKRPDEAEKIRAGQSATKSLMDEVGNLQGFISKNGTFDWPLFEKSQGKIRGGNLARITGYLTTMLQTGTLQQPEYDRYMNMLDSGVLQSRDGAKEVLQELKTAGSNAYNNRIRSQGIKYENQQAPGSASASSAPKPVKKQTKLGDMYEVEL